MARKRKKRSMRKLMNKLKNIYENPKLQASIKLLTTILNWMKILWEVYDKMN